MDRVESNNNKSIKIIPQITNIQKDYKVHKVETYQQTL